MTTTIFAMDHSMGRCKDWLRRAGGYPLMRIAEFYQIPYADVLLYSDWLKKIKREEEVNCWEHGAMVRINGLHEAQRNEIFDLLVTQEEGFRTPGWPQ